MFKIHLPKEELQSCWGWGKVWYCLFTRNNLFVSHLSPGIQLLNSLQSHGCLLFANEMTDGWWFPERKAWLEVCKSSFSSHPFQPFGLEVTLEWISISQWCKQYSPQKERQQSYKLPEYLADSWGVGYPQSSKGSLCFFGCLHYVSLSFGCSLADFRVSLVAVKSHVSLSSVRHSSKLSKPQERAVGNLNLLWVDGKYRSPPEFVSSF